MPRAARPLPDSCPLRPLRGESGGNRADAQLASPGSWVSPRDSVREVAGTARLRRRPAPLALTLGGAFASQPR
jgi:hypothetical protein